MADDVGAHLLTTAERLCDGALWEHKLKQYVCFHAAKV